MTYFALRTDLPRVAVNGFAFPLGVAAAGSGTPAPGYTLSYTASEDEQPDIYTFHIVVSHERLAGLCRDAFDLLADEVYAILELGSRDAYRTIDVFMGDEPVARETFLATWREYEHVFLEDCSIAVGANCEEPFIEVFLDHLKGLVIHAPLMMRDEIEDLLERHGVEEVERTWVGGPADNEDDDTAFRDVLAPLDDGHPPEMDELLMVLRQHWRLELNIDPATNVDEAGRELGMTLWHAVALLDHLDDPDREGVLILWATADSIQQMETLIDATLATQNEWRFRDLYSIDRVAFDERPDELAELPARRDKTEVHLARIDDGDIYEFVDDGDQKHDLHPDDDDDA